MNAYYNENDPAAAEWLHNSIRAGLIAPGDVDTRSITEVQADDIRHYTQHHLFAGIGGWSVAARLAGWPDDRPLLTGSCPCQPFSTAGKRAGTDDSRHLWPDLYRLIAALRPPVAVGEQVASKDGLNWLDGVCTDLEASGYACRAVDIPALAVNAPHKRNRLYWVAMGDGERAGLERHAGHGDASRASKKTGSIAEADGTSFWREHAWLTCHDGKARRIPEPGFPMLAHGVRGRISVHRPGTISATFGNEETREVSRIALWKGFGNAIVPQLGAQVLGALMDVIDDTGGVAREMKRMGDGM